MPAETKKTKRRLAALCSSIFRAVATRRAVAIASLVVVGLPLGWVVTARGAQQFGLSLGNGAGEPAMARYVTAGDDAFLLGEPELLAGPRVTQVSVSPDERYAFAVRERTDLAITASALAQGGKPDGEYGEISIITWNRRTRRASVAWKAPRTAPLTTQISRAEWLPGTSSLYVTIAQLSADGAGGRIDDAAAYLVNAANGSARKITNITGPESVFVSPTYGVAAINNTPPKAFSSIKEEKEAAVSTVCVIGSDGSVKRAVALPPGSSLFEIAPNGGTLYALRFEWTRDEKTGKSKTLSTFYAVSVASGEARELPSKPEFSNKDTEAQENALKAQIAALPVGLADGDGTARRGATASQGLHSVWLTALGADATPTVTPTPPKVEAATTNSKPAPPSVTEVTNARLYPQTALVVADADAQGLTKDAINWRSWDETGKMDARGARLLADGNAVLYRDRSGALFMRPVVRVNKTAFVEARKQALRAQTLSNGKQIALGILMYTQDYDEVFPPRGGATQTQIGPYTKNEDLFLDTLTGQPGFTYVGGGKLAAIDEVAQTPIGYLTGPGGRVIIYADGHVKWE